MHKVMDWLARGFAMAGGAALAAMILLICASVVGRQVNGILHSDVIEGLAPGLAAALLSTGIGPINGDFEIVEAAMAFAIFAFLPICTLRYAHASVDIFTSALSPGANRVLRLATDILFAAVLVVIFWQLTLAGMSKHRSGQTTLLLEFPVWWSYAACIVAMAVAALVGVYVAAARVVEFASGRPSGLTEDGADH
jgi:TRAP-type C4-dicarboxylate transport system permease small subunit